MNLSTILSLSTTGFLKILSFIKQCYHRHYSFVRIGHAQIQVTLSLRLSLSMNFSLLLTISPTCQELKISPLNYRVLLLVTSSYTKCSLNPAIQDELQPQLSHTKFVSVYRDNILTLNVLDSICPLSSQTQLSMVSKL